MIAFPITHAAGIADPQSANRSFDFVANGIRGVSRCKPAWSVDMSTGLPMRIRSQS
jgi:hypothetical protein